MIYLPAALLEPGMVLACEVPSPNPRLPLMVAGQTLTQAAILNVQARGMPGLYIEHKSSDDIVYDPILPPEQKQGLLSDIRQEFDKVTKRNAEPDYRSISKMAESIVMSVLGRDHLLCNIMDIRDYDGYTYSHSLYVGMLSAVLGAHCKLPPTQLTDLATAGLLHDIGKLDISQKIINKNGSLSSDEFTLIKEHPTKAVQRLRRRFGEHSLILQGVGSHHEHFDGSGYPFGTSGTRIPLYGRMLAIADVYDALSANRSYRKAWSPSEIHDYLLGRTGSQFDETLLKTFMRAVPAYPKGTLVRLSDESIGIVLRSHVELPLRPLVRLVAPPERRNEEIDLSGGHFGTTILGLVSEPSSTLVL